jgi:ubiquitin-protein ligase
MWWIYQKDRFSIEKSVIYELESIVGWLQVDKWQANDELAICVTFQVLHIDKIFRFKMIYPSVFPDSPPMIYTEDKVRISWHQYGADGELCLEYRPDNWQSSINGADMIASLHRLLSEEQHEDGHVTHAHSAHVSSLGRDLRSKVFRFLLTAGDLNSLNTLAKGKPEKVCLKQRFVSKAFVTSLMYVGDKDHPHWTSDLALPHIDKDDMGFVVRISDVEISNEPDIADIRKLLESLEITKLCKDVLENDSFTNLILGDKDNWFLLNIYGDIEDRKIIRFTTIQIPEHKNRLPENFFSLSDKKVGVVGCGSVGSKIAVSLCRSGVGNFLFIDEDIFFPDNVVRNDLDLSYVGVHKTEALQDRLRKINPNVDTQTLRLSLGGQESASSMSMAMESLGNCDLIVDATAEASAFNWIASVSKRRRKPMIWIEVFGGGIGGLVARARPELDPVPLFARNQIEKWCAEQGVEALRATQANDYSVQRDDGLPFIADDADVSVISAHAARFVTDILTRPEASIFPYSAYLIGMSSEWIFQAPFDTRPIDLQPEGEWGETSDAPDSVEIIQLLKEYLPTKDE